MARYRKKPVVIDAVQLRWSTWNEVCDFLGGALLAENPGGAREIEADEASDTCSEPGPTYIALDVRTVHGEIAAVRHGDWIIPEAAPGKFYPCKPDVFERTYEAADVKREPGGALIEILETDATTQETGGNSVAVPNEVRINGTPLLVADKPITIHEIEIPARTGVRASDLAMVTLTLYARRVTIAAEGDLS